MNITLECMPCFVRHTLEVLKEFSDNDALNERVMRNVLAQMAELDYKISPPEFAAEIHAFIRTQLDCDDPYLKIKQDSNKLAEKVVKKLEEKLKLSDDPFKTAVLYAIAGNIIDSGVSAVTPVEEVIKSVEMAEKDPPAIDHFEMMREKLSTANEVLILGDNAGEVFFDRLMLQHFPNGKKFTYAVKSGAILNDATRSDAHAADLHNYADLIENGTRFPGTPLSQVSPTFQSAFSRADLIIAKGQANFETLSHICDDRIFFLLRAKCEVIAGKIGVPKGSFVILCNQEKIV